MATYQKRKSKAHGERFTVTVRVYPYPAQSKTFGRMAEARAWAEDLESDIRNGRLKLSKDGAKVTLAELIDRYILETFHKRRSPDFPRTVLEFWKEKLGHYRLSDINKSVVRQIWKSLETKVSERTGKFLTNRTLNGYIEPLSSCFSYAVSELDWIEVNPCHGLRRRSVAGNWRLRILTEDEMKRLLNAVSQSSNDYLMLACLLALSTGARRGELMKLTWDDVNLSIGQLTFRETKNGYSRTVMMSESARVALIKHSKVRRLDTTLIFPRRKPLWKQGNGTSSKKWEDLHKPFERALEKAEISNYHWHDLRHQAASFLIGSGASLEEVGKILGHRTPQTTWRYAKLLQERNLELVSAVDEIFIKGCLAGYG